jgi:hypothetical protein
MIKIEVGTEVQRSFPFPSNVTTAIEFYSEIRNLTNWLPHISLINSYSNNEFRMLYNSIELGVYRILIYCDLQSYFDMDNLELHITPLQGVKSVRVRAGMNSITAQGYYSSLSKFVPNGDATKIDYKLVLKARLPVPFAARIIPVSVLDAVASGIIERRVTEIAEGFIQNSVTAYRHNHG